MDKAAPKKPTNKAPSKSQVLAGLSEASQVPKKEVAAVLAALTEQIRSNLGPAGPGLFVIPGLVKIEKKQIDAKPARIGVRMPSGEIRDLPPKPATTKLRLRALKGLKDMVAQE